MALRFLTIRRVVAWSSIVVLGAASWLPSDEMIRTGADGRLEHATAYLVSGLATFTAYPRSSKWLIAIFMTCYAGTLELGQLFVPGRHAAILDWLAGSGGVLCALLLCEIYHRKRGANRELARWLLDHPRYPASVVAGWLGWEERRIQRLRKWAADGFIDLPNSRYKDYRNPAAPPDVSLKTQDNSDSEGAHGRRAEHSPLKTHDNSESEAANGGAPPIYR